MNASTLLRPAAAALLCVVLSGCGVEVQNDGHMFERWADDVGKIPVSDAPPNAAGDPTGVPGLDPTAAPDAAAAGAAAAQAAGLRQPMVIDVVDRIDMPNAKEAGLRAALDLVHVAATPARSGGDAEAAGLRRAIDAVGPFLAHRTAEAAAKPVARTVQLAAYPNDADARAAWRSLAAAHPDAFSGVRPRFEHANLGAKGVWTRLKVGPLASPAAARRVCAAARLDPERCA